MESLEGLEGEKTERPIEWEGAKIQFRSGYHRLDPSLPSTISPTHRHMEVWWDSPQVMDGWNDQ